MLVSVNVRYLSGKEKEARISNKWKEQARESYEKSISTKPRN